MAKEWRCPNCGMKNKYRALNEKNEPIYQFEFCLKCDYTYRNPTIFDYMANIAIHSKNAIQSDKHFGETMDADYESKVSEQIAKDEGRL